MVVDGLVKKNPAEGGVFVMIILQRLLLYDILCSRTFRAVNYIKFYTGAFSKRLESL